VMFSLRGRLYKFTVLIHDHGFPAGRQIETSRPAGKSMDRRSEIRRIVEEIISERSRDNSGNRPHTSVSGEQPST
jgi:hypothetical protein